MASLKPNIKDFQNDELVISVHTVGPLCNNCILLYSPRTLNAIIIDSGNDNDAILKLIKKLQLKVQKLLYTHAHYDHIASADIIRSSMAEARVFINENESPLYEAFPQQMLMLTGEKVNKLLPIDCFINEDQTLGIDDSSSLSPLLKCIHTPGHTPGHICFLCNYFPTPILFSGDTLFQQSIGRTDLPGGNFNQIQKSIKEKLFTLPDNTVVIPGHGNFTTIGDEKKSNPYIKP
ncbi:MAG: MBL fold metallo-hydrolase [Oligoflexia bacterium]|nr:MBL fold metallo-hydrolase [Oligoflexia bacterium]